MLAILPKRIFKEKHLKIIELLNISRIRNQKVYSTCSKTIRTVTDPLCTIRKIKISIYCVLRVNVYKRFVPVKKQFLFSVLGYSYTWHEGVSICG